MTRMLASVVWFAATLCAIGLSTALATNNVVLVHPPAADPFIEEIFHRLTGELRVHPFSIKQEEGTGADVSLPVAQELLTRTRADACVFVSWRGETSVVRVWVAGAATPPALFEAVALHRTPEAPTMLAARAIDLLTAALGPRGWVQPVVPSPNPGADPTIGVASTTPNASATVQASSSVAASAWSIDAGATMIDQLSTFGAAWGPRVSLERVVSPRLKVAALLAGPLMGADHANTAASARLIQCFGLIELLVAAARMKFFELSAAGGAGAYFVRTDGAIADGISSFQPARSDHATSALSLGAEVAVAVTTHLSLVASARALFLLPRPRVAVGRDNVRYIEPLLAVAASIRFRF